MPRTHIKSRRAHVEVQLLGGFAVRVDGHPVALPRGNSATLAKLLLLRRGPLSIDQAIDAIWPTSDLITGRNRLRNVLARTNAALVAAGCHTGPVQRSGDLFVLCDEVSYDVDFWTATDNATRLIQAVAPTVESLADSIAALRPQLLPGDSYESWLEGPQAERVRLLVHLARRQFDVARDGGLDYIARCARELCLDLDPMPFDFDLGNEPALTADSSLRRIGATQ